MDDSFQHSLEFTIDVYAQQLDELRSALNLNEPVFIAGHSTGGGTAMLHAATKPELCLGLILIDTICYPPTKPLLAQITELPLLNNVLEHEHNPRGELRHPRKDIIWSG